MGGGERVGSKTENAPVDIAGQRMCNRILNPAFQAQLIWATLPAASLLLSIRIVIWKQKTVSHCCLKKNPSSFC
ncbi:MAG TPA: hypothetical protein VFW05_19410 [Verrucomicrobiae bacterium]|jgi:hypothetical protein|nr:hypothetical protein [Verrucomicrobiae bacterium]